MIIRVTVKDEGEVLYEWNIIAGANPSLTHLAARAVITEALRDVVEHLLVDSFCPDFQFTYANHTRDEEP